MIRSKNSSRSLTPKFRSRNNSLHNSQEIKLLANKRKLGVTESYAQANQIDLLTSGTDLLTTGSLNTSHGTSTVAQISTGKIGSSVTLLNLSGISSATATSKDKQTNLNSNLSPNDNINKNILNINNISDLNSNVNKSKSFGHLHIKSHNKIYISNSQTNTNNHNTCNNLTQLQNTTKLTASTNYIKKKFTKSYSRDSEIVNLGWGSNTTCISNSLRNFKTVGIKTSRLGSSHLNSEIPRSKSSSILPSRLLARSHSAKSRFSEKMALSRGNSRQWGWSLKFGQKLDRLKFSQEKSELQQLFL